MGKKTDLEILKSSRKTVHFWGKDYRISELTLEVGFAFIKFLGQVDFITNGKVKDFVRNLVEKSGSGDKTDVDKFIKEVAENFLDFIFAFVNTHTQEYFYEFIALTLTDWENNVEFTVQEAKRLKLKEAMKIVNSFLEDEDMREMLKDSFFLSGEKGTDGL